VTYQPEAATALTGLQFVKYDNDYAYFTYNATINNSTICYQIATDDQFTEASLLDGMGWRSFTVGSGALLCLYVGDMDPGKTYYIRAVNYARSNAKRISELTDAEIVALNPAVTSFTTPGTKAPKNISGLKLYKENADAFEFVDPNSGEVLKSPSGDVGKIGIIKVRVKNATDQTNTNKAKLRIVVSTAASVQDGEVIVVENLCPGHDYNEYTLVQNMI
jgi:hypothetical protein